MISRNWVAGCNIVRPPVAQKPIYACTTSGAHAHTCASSSAARLSCRQHLDTYCCMLLYAFFLLLPSPFVPVIKMLSLQRTICAIVVVLVRWLHVVKMQLWLHYGFTLSLETKMSVKAFKKIAKKRKKI